jgi:hypothetical protein
MQSTAGPLIHSYNNSVLENHKRLMNSDDYEQRKNSEYVAPYEKYALPKQPAGQQSDNAQNNNPVVKKGYNAKTNQTQLIYADGSKKIVDGAQ